MIQSIHEVFGSDPLLDVLAFLRRSELDTLELVDVRFHDLIMNSMSMLCLRRLSYAGLLLRGSERLFFLDICVDGASKNNRFPTGAKDENDAFNKLLNACRSSKVKVGIRWG